MYFHYMKEKKKKKTKADSFGLTPFRISDTGLSSLKKKGKYAY